MINSKLSRKVVSNILRSFLLVLLLPLIIIGVLYYQNVKALENTAYERQLTALVKGGEQISENQVQLETLTEFISRSPYLQSYILADNPLEKPDHLMSYRNIRDFLVSFSIIDSPFDYIMLYSQSSETAIIANSIVLRLEDNYGTLFSVNSMDYITCKENFFDRTYQKEFLFDIPMKQRNQEDIYTVFAHTITNLSVNRQINLFFPVSHKVFLSPLENTTISPLQWHFVMPLEGTFIYSAPHLTSDLMEDLTLEMTQPQGSFVTKVQGEKTLVSYYRNNKTQSLYASGVPYSEIMKPTRWLQGVFLALLLAAILSSILLAVIAAYRSAQPTLSLFSLLGKQDAEGDYSLHFINEQVKDLMDSHHQLEQQVKKQLPSQKIAILYRLLNSLTPWTQDFKEQLEGIGLDTQAPLYGVLMIIINDMEGVYAFEEVSAYKVLLNKYIREYPIDVFATFHNDTDKEVLIISSDKGEYTELLDEIEQFSKALYHYMLSNHHVSISFAGSIAQEAKGLSRAYYETTEAAEYQQPLNDLQVLWYKKASPKPLLFSYPLEWEQQLIVAIEQGEEKACKQLLDTLYKANFVRLSISDSSQKLLVESMLSTILRIEGETQEMQHEALTFVEDFAFSDIIEDSFLLVAQWMLACCREQSSKVIVETISLVEQAEQIVRENFTDPQISLASVADLLEVSESYLSRLLKEQTGRNFSTTLETLRMERAVVLLRDDTLRIAQVATLIGYNSAQVFRRAFRRYYGCSPSEYRE